MTRAAKKRLGFWGHSRRAFRWCRITMWSIVLLAVFSLLYLNKVGLPKFIKARVVASLEAQGLNVEFSRLRLRGFRHIVIDNMRLNATNASAPLNFEAKVAELQFNSQQLRRLQFDLEALEIDNGRLTVDLRSTNAFVVDNINTRLRVHPEDRWTLQRFEGEALGAHWRVSGSLTNLMALNKKRPDEQPKPPADWAPGLRDVVDVLAKIQFSAPPEVSVTALGDLNDLARFKTSLSIRGNSASTPWGEGREIFIRSSLGPSARPGEAVEANVSIRVKGATTPWGKLDEATFLAQTVYPLTNTASFESAWTFNADDAETEWFSGRKIDVTLGTRQSGTNLLTLVQASAATGKFAFGAADRATFQARLEHAYPVGALNKFLFDLLPVKPAVPAPLAPDEKLLTLGQRWAGDWRLNLEYLRVKNGTAGNISFTGDIRERADAVATDATWGDWKTFAPFLISWKAEATDFRNGEARIEKVAAAGNWNAPTLAISAIDSQLYGGSFHLDATLDVPSRQVAAQTKVDFDLKKIAWLLDPAQQPLIDALAWEQPPVLEAKIAFVLPPWKNPPATWRDDTLQSAVVDGSFALGPASYRGVACTALATHFSLTNLHWRLPNFVLTRPEGALELDYAGSLADTAFRLGIRGGIDPAAAAPLLDDSAKAAFKFVQFHQPPFIEGALAGDFKKLETLNFDGRFAASNFVVRGEPFVDVRTRVAYSNLWIYCNDLVLHRTTNEVLSADLVNVDLRRNIAMITNGFSTTDPYRFTKVLGPVIYKAIAPYVFAKPPSVRLEGIIPLENENDADLRFDIKGEDFAYWRFKASEAKGGVHWHQQYLDVTNFTAKFYGGNIDWEGHFIFRPGSEAAYNFRGVITNTDFSAILRDLFPTSTNKLDGTVNGTLVITEADTESFKSWKGHGHATLKDGFLWDIPVFGIFSGPLDAVMPGFGKSKIHSGKGTFRVEDGKIITKDMDVRAPAFRLNYNGSVDFDGNLDAKVEAEMFRDTWVFGRAFSAVLWPLAKAFESKVTGNLSAPKSELAHIPKIMLFPLRPIQTLKELLPKDKEKEKEKKPE
jgi:hypothetical protein